jgi:hypothetical protein
MAANHSFWSANFLGRRAITLAPLGSGTYKVGCSFGVRQPALPPQGCRMVLLRNSIVSASFERGDIAEPATDVRAL